MVHGRDRLTDQAYNQKSFMTNISNICMAKWECNVCGTKFHDDDRFDRHIEMHERRKKKGKKQKDSHDMPDFERPGFGHVM